MEHKFKLAADGMKDAKVDSLSNEEKLFLYSRFKQATIGKNTTEKPGGWLDVKGKAKWDAWTELGDMSKEQAMAEYVGKAKTYVSADIASQL